MALDILYPNGQILAVTPFGTSSNLPDTSTVTSVNAAMANTVLLAANSARLGATIENDSTSVLYLKLGAVATSSSYTVRMVSLSYFEVPYGYTGIISGIWVAVNGAARITELT